MACCLAGPIMLGIKPLPDQVKGPVIQNAMTAMLRHSSNNATKPDFGITNDYISSERVWRWALLLDIRRRFAFVIFIHIFFQENDVNILIWISLKFVPGCSVKNLPTLVEIMA